MGTDTPLAVLSERPRLLFDYFKQLFAQVTNPPLDAIREEVVTAVGSTVGPEANLLEPGPASCRQLILPFPIIDNDELAKIIHIDDDGDRPGLAGGRDLRPVPGRRRRGRAAGGPRRRLREGVRGDRAGRPDHRAVRPQRRHGRGPDPVAAAHGGRPPSPGAHEAAHDGRADHRDRRRPRSAPHGPADRVRRRCDQPVPRLRIGRGPDHRGHARPRQHGPDQGGPQLHQGLWQGRAQGDVEDGGVDGGVVHRSPDLRGDRPRRRRRRPVLHGHRVAARWDRALGDRRRGGRPSPHGQSDPSRGAGPSPARTRRRVPVAA